MHRAHREMRENMEYRYSAIVHPKNGGDDYRITGKVVLAGGIEDRKKDLVIVAQQIRKTLKKEGSAVFNDYKILS